MSTGNVPQRYKEYFTPPNGILKIFSVVFNTYFIFIVMTIEQLKESYMFKIIKRALMKQYPWIKDVEIDNRDFDDYKTIIFLNAYIDPHELGEEMDWEVARWVTPGYDGGTSVGMFFKGNNPEYRELTDEVNEFIDEVRISPAIP